MGNERPVWDGLFLNFLFLFFILNRARTLIYCCNGFSFLSLSLSLFSMMMCLCNDWAGIEALYETNDGYSGVVFLSNE